MPPVEDERRDEPVDPVDEAPPGTEADEPAVVPEAPGVVAAAGGDSPPDEAVAPGADPYVRPDPKDVDLKLPLAVLFGPILLVWLGVLVAPEIFWDQFVAPYYWDPIVADEGFNTVNTFTWALLMGAIIFLVWRIVQKIEQPIDFAVIAAVLPYMAAGSIARVLEDTGFYVEPLRYFFITPIIYVVIVAVAVFWIIVGHLLRKHAEEVGPLNAVKALAAFFGIIWVAYTVWSFYGDALSDFGNPVVLLLAFVVPLAYFWNYTKQTGRFSQVGVMTTFGVAFLLYALYYVVLWHTGQQWENVASDKFVPDDAGSDMRPLVYLALLVFPAVFTGAVYWFAKKKTSTADPSLVAFAYRAPVNLLLIHAQMMDATMTALGIDVFGYSEKHVLPAFLIEGVQGFGGTAAEYAATLVMLPIKFAVALLVVWAIDIYARDDVKQYPDLVGLAKLAIIMVGFAPAVRNTVRLAMDV